MHAPFLVIPAEQVTDIKASLFEKEKAELMKLITEFGKNNELLEKKMEKQQEKFKKQQEVLEKDMARSGRTTRWQLQGTRRRWR